MACNVIPFIIKTLAALTCLASVSELISLPYGTYCTTSDSTACTQHYPNSVCYHEEKVCKFGDSCQCATGYAVYSVYNYTFDFFEYSCRPATVPVGGLCSIQVGNTCSGNLTYCNYHNETYSVCECSNNYKPNADRTDCIPSNLDQVCTGSGSSNDCGDNAYCDSRQMRCRCHPGYKPFDATDCTHYALNETCPETECDFVESGALSCGYGTCKNGVFECIPGSRWWQYSTPNGEEPSPLVKGECLKNTVTLVSTGELCDSYACRSRRCVRCPEQRDVDICNG